MPESAVKFAALESSFKTVDEMCDYFDVSGAAMRIRLNDLGLI